MTRATKQLLEQTKKRRLKNTVESRGIIEADSRVEIQEWVWSSDAFRIKAVLGELFECISSSGREGERAEEGADEEASLGLSRLQLVSRIDRDRASTSKSILYV